MIDTPQKYLGQPIVSDDSFLRRLPVVVNMHVAPLHPKAMPVILHPDDYERWLREDYEGACALAAPFPSQLMALAQW